MLFEPSPSAQPFAAGLDLLTKDMATIAVAGAAAVALFLIFLMFLVKNFLYICRPNEALIFTGGKRKDHDGKDIGPLVILGRGNENQGPEYHGCGRGRAWRIPVFETVKHFDMSAMAIDISVNNAYSVGNIPLRIQAIANVKISSDPRLIRNAIERFLDQSPQEIQNVARQTLEGALREVLAQMTPEAVNEDRLAFAENLIKSAQDDLDKLGLHLDTLKIQHVSDETGYLDSLGRPLIAAVLRDAENAENQASQEVSEAQAEANRRAETAKALAETAILMKRNALQQTRSELDGKALAIEREAEAAAKTARAAAEQELQGVRAELEEKRLMADVIIPAEVKRAAEAILAKGAAAPTIEHGAAIAEVLQATGDAWKAMGSKAKEIYVIQHLEEILASVIDSVDKIKVREVTVLDRGDGSGIASYAASFPHAVAAVLSALRETTGIDVPAILAGEGSSK